MVSPSWGSFQKPSNSDQNIQPEQSKITSDEQKPEGQKPQWGNFQNPMSYQGEPDPTEEESTFGYLARNISAIGSRVGEQLLGRTGNIEKFGKEFVTNHPSSLGVVGWALSELMGPERWERLVKGPKGRQQIFPTSEQLKEASQELTGGYTKPKTPGEEKLQEKVEDIASTITGRTIRTPTLRNIGLNNIVTPIAAGITKDIVKDLGFSEEKSNLAKMAVWFPMSLAFNVNAQQYASNLMNQGRNGFNQNLQVSIPRYQNDLNRVSRNMLQGDPGSALAQQQIAGIRNDLASGQTTIRNLLTRYDAINRAKRSKDLFALNKTDKIAAIGNINQVRDVVRNEIQQLGQSNPQSLQSWQNGVQAWATIHRSKSISNWIESIAKGPYAKLALAPGAALFGIGSLGAVKAPLIAAPLAAASGSSYKTGQILYRMYNDPNLRNYYWEAISAAQMQNIPAFIHNYEKLNKKLEESSSANPKQKSKR